MTTGAACETEHIINDTNTNANINLLNFMLCYILSIIFWDVRIISLFTNTRAALRHNALCWNNEHCYSRIYTRRIKPSYPQADICAWPFTNTYAMLRPHAPYMSIVIHEYTRHVRPSHNHVLPPADIWASMIRESELWVITGDTRWVMPMRENISGAAGIPGPWRKQPFFSRMIFWVDNSQRSLIASGESHTHSASRTPLENSFWV